MDLIKIPCVKLSIKAFPRNFLLYINIRLSNISKMYPQHIYFVALHCFSKDIIYVCTSDRNVFFQLNSIIMIAILPLALFNIIFYCVIQLISYQTNFIHFVYKTFLQIQVYLKVLRKKLWGIYNFLYIQNGNEIILPL